MPRGRKKVVVSKDTANLMTNPKDDMTIASFKMSGRKKSTVSKSSTGKAPVETIILQASGAEWDIGNLKEKAISAYVAEGHRRGRIRIMTLYVKPEERKVYYVINDRNTGSIDI